MIGTLNKNIASVCFLLIKYSFNVHVFTDGEPAEAEDNSRNESKSENQAKKTPESPEITQSAEGGKTEDNQTAKKEKAEDNQSSDSWFSAWGVSNISKMVENTVMLVPIIPYFLLY
jgi:hypothetical protein